MSDVVVGARDRRRAEPGRRRHRRGGRHLARRPPLRIKPVRTAARGPSETGSSTPSPTPEVRHDRQSLRRLTGACTHSAATSSTRVSTATGTAPGPPGASSATDAASSGGWTSRRRWRWPRRNSASSRPGRPSRSRPRPDVDRIDLAGPGRRSSAPATRWSGLLRVFQKARAEGVRGVHALWSDHPGHPGHRTVAGDARRPGRARAAAAAHRTASGRPGRGACRDGGAGPHPRAAGAADGVRPEGRRLARRGDPARRAHRSRCASGSWRRSCSAASARWPASATQALELLERFAARLGPERPDDRLARRPRPGRRVRRPPWRSSPAHWAGSPTRSASCPGPSSARSREAWRPGKVGSSTMPHKRNPEACEQAVVMARLAAAQAGPALAAMIGDHERDSRALRIEWAVVPDVAHYMLAACEMVRRSSAACIVHTDRLRGERGRSPTRSHRAAHAGPRPAPGKQTGARAGVRAEPGRPARRRLLRDLVRTHETGKLLSEDELARNLRSRPLPRPVRAPDPPRGQPGPGSGCVPDGAPAGARTGDPLSRGRVCTSTIGHVVRKLTGHYLPGETGEAKALGCWPAGRAGPPSRG